MTFYESKPADVELAHRWQEFRIRCLKLALKAGATTTDVTEIADKLGEYILTRSKREIENMKRKEEEIKEDGP